jgi:7-cyano-7-deazaguanine synthase in queuosine biosynthesis
MNILVEENISCGILLSGGLDSAILLYLLISNNKNLNIQPFTIPKRDGAYLYVDPIIEFYSKKFNIDIPKTIKVGNSDAHHSQQNISAALEIFKNFKIEKLFIGINRIPFELKGYPGAPNRATKSLDSRIIFPFVDFTKDKILSMLFENDLEELMLLTHSCTEQTSGRCNLCWQCKERAWAFNQLNKNDIGVN